MHLVADGKIPPEADITSPSWWQPLPAAGRVDVVGRVAAPRASSYTYEVQFAPGVQPPRWPLTDTWTTVANGSGATPKKGVLTTLNLDQVRAAIDKAPPVYTPADDPTSRDLPEKDAFRVRVVVHLMVTFVRVGMRVPAFAVAVRVDVQQAPARAHDQAQRERDDHHSDGRFGEP